MVVGTGGCAVSGESRITPPWLGKVVEYPYASLCSLYDGSTALFDVGRKGVGFL